VEPHLRLRLQNHNVTKGANAVASARILVVEDEGIVAEEIRSRLKKLRYEAAVASSGEEAIKKAEETRPDLVLMDIRLRGDIDGVEAAQEIRARFDIPVVYVTAYTDEATLQRAKTTEPYGYILKPFEDKELRTSIEVALYKHNIERRLRESERWLATTLRSIGDAVITTSAKGQVLFMNPVAEALTGWKDKEALGKQLTEVFNIVSEKTHEVAENPVEKVIREGIVVDLTNHILIARDGREIPIDDSAAPIRDDKGNITGVVLVFYDVSERKRAEAELTKYRQQLEELVEERTTDLRKTNELLEQEIIERKQAEKTLRELYKQERELYRQLEEEMERRIEFIRALAHELKTPLTPVVMSSQVLASAVKDETLLRLARNISRGASNLNSRIDELLDLARSEIGMLQLKPEQVDVLQLIREVVDDVAPVHASREQSLVLRLPPSLPPVWGDRIRLRQIVLNLLNNAFKFTPAGGKITLRAKQEDGNLVVEVKDTGPGIAEEDQQRIFEPYQRKESDRERLSGLGLGLALCKTLVELHRGRIWIKSRAGRGSTFGFSLPLEGPKAAASPDGQAPTNES
jgi:PAS domain S-box-containing protein